MSDINNLINKLDFQLEQSENLLKTLKSNYENKSLTGINAKNNKDISSQNVEKINTENNQINNGLNDYSNNNIIVNASNFIIKDDMNPFSEMQNIRRDMKMSLNDIQNDLKNLKNKEYNIE